MKSPLFLALLMFAMFTGDLAVLPGVAWSRPENPTKWIRSGRECRADFVDFEVRWQPFLISDNEGWQDPVSVYELTNAGVARKPEFRVLLNPNLTVESAAAWAAPESPAQHEYPVEGFLLVCGFPTGSEQEYMIYGKVRGHWGKVFEGNNGGGNEGAVLEAVDLDGDGWPEIISFVPNRVYSRPQVSRRDGSLIWKLDTQATRALVWRWSDSLGRYRLVRRTSYADRLRPLTKLRPRRR